MKQLFFSSALIFLLFSQNAAFAQYALSHERISVRNYGAACDGIVDDSQKLANAANELRGTGTEIYIPGNCRIRMAGAAQPWLSGVAIVADGVREYGTPPNQAVYGQQGGTVIIDAALTGASPFVVSSDWAFRGVNFYWAGQTEAAAVANSGNPIIYPALVAQHGTDNVVNWEVYNCQIENAYDILDFHAAGKNVGFFHFTHNLAYAFDKVFYLQGAGGESFIEHNDFTPAAYYFGTLGQITKNLLNYGALNETIFYIIGNGTGSTNSTTPVAGLHLTQNYVYAAHAYFNNIGGSVNLASIVGDSLDTTGNGLLSSAGGAFSSVDVTGGTWLIGTLNSPSTVGEAIQVASGSGPNNSLTLNGVAITAVAGPGIQFYNTQTSASLNNSLTLNGGSVSHVGNISGSARNGIEYNATGGGTLIVNGVQINTSNVAETAASGINVAGVPASVALTGNTISGFGIPLTLNQTTGKCSVSSNIATGTLVAGKTIAGAGAALCAQSANNWDQGTLTQIVSSNASTITIYQPVNILTVNSTYTGQILQAGTFQGQQITLINSSVNPITWNTTDAIAHVQSASSNNVAANSAVTFTYDTTTALWFKS